MNMKTKKTRIAVTISMPQDIAKEYENLSRITAKNKSVLFREMFREYKQQILEKEFRELQTYGGATARKKGLFTEAEVEKLVYQGR
jgi:metal-responsive CopG/Arc/MetJ family transcriptional regulator